VSSLQVPLCTQHKCTLTCTHTSPLILLVVLDDASKAEALHMLHRIRELREQHTKTLPPVMNKVYHTLAMLHYVLQDFTKVSKYLTCVYMQC